MASLSNQWLTEGWIDFEYKKYQLQAFLQEASNNFDAKKLYPKLSELITHYEQLQVFSTQKKLLTESFPKEISRLDFEQFLVTYESVLADDSLMQELNDIVSFGLKEMKSKLNTGKELYEEVEQQVEIFPIGIQPLRTDEGYFFLNDYLQKLISVYHYEITIFESYKEQYRGIKTTHLANYKISVTKNYESIRYELVKTNRSLPNPATYAVEFKASYPFTETMLPVAKRSLIRAISKPK
jgi:hypothetical protein